MDLNKPSPLPHVVFFVIDEAKTEGQEEWLRYTVQVWGGTVGSAEAQRQRA